MSADFIYLRNMKQIDTSIVKEDFRSASGDVRFSIRKRGIALIKSGRKKFEVAELFGVNKNTVTNWWKSYLSEGHKGLQDKKRGARSDNCKLLSINQEVMIQTMLVDTYPDQYKLPFALWTCKAVKELVKMELDIDIARTTMGEYLRRWGFSPQKPKKKAYEQKPAEVKKWLEETYPALKERAKIEGAEIHWGDETGCKNQCNHGRSYAPKGKTPVKESMSKSFKINMISTITNQGKVQFMIYSENLNANKLIEFLEQLIKSCDRKIFLILDNLKVHHCHIVKEWLAQKEIKRKLEIFFLPSYSPELNPDEYLNCDLKRGLSDKPAPKTASELQKNVENHMTMLQQTSERVAKYFKHKDIQYAA
jgi:transposase